MTEYYSSTIPPQNASGTPHFANITIRNLTASAYQPGKRRVTLRADRSSERVAH